MTVIEMKILSWVG